MTPDQKYNEAMMIIANRHWDPKPCLKGCPFCIADEWQAMAHKAAEACVDATKKIAEATAKLPTIN